MSVEGEDVSWINNVEQSSSDIICVEVEPGIREERISLTIWVKGGDI